MSDHADIVREALRLSHRKTDAWDAAYRALDALVAELADALHEAADMTAGQTAALAEVARIKDAAQWLIDNRGHRGEEQAWKLLEKALTDG